MKLSPTGTWLGIELSAWVVISGTDRVLMVTLRSAPRQSLRRHRRASVRSSVSASHGAESSRAECVNGDETSRPGRHRREALRAGRARPHVCFDAVHACTHGTRNASGRHFEKSRAFSE